MFARRATCRRNACVASSATQTDSKKSAASSSARIAQSTLSVLTFASAIARVFCGLDTTTRATCGAISRTTACVLHVASIATSSSGASGQVAGAANY